MSDGLLKKLIDKLFEKHWATDGDWVTFSMIEPILDVAKKEFPKLTVPSLVIDTLPQIVHMSYDEIKELMVWKKRWLGDST